MRATGYSKSRLSQLLRDGYPFVERAARELALACGKPEDYFETMDAGTAAFAIRFNELPEAAKAKWEQLVELLTQGKP